MSTRTLADVGTSCAAAVGVAGFTDRLGLGDARHAVIVLIDGLGARLVERHAPEGSFLAAVRGPSIDAVFPTTTVTALASMGTGLMPGAHGMVGGSFLLPETGAVLAPLQWGGDPHPLAVQPEPTVFETAAASGVRVTTIAPGAYASSGLTRAALRGAHYRPAEDIEQRLALLGQELQSGGRALTYVYWPELDRIGHGFGVASPQWRDGLARVDDLLGGINALLRPGDVAVVTADHGMVDITERIDIEADPALMAEVATIAGEPRLRHAYAVSDAAADRISARWRDRLGDRATVWTRSELVESGLLGTVEPDLVERVGDVITMAGPGVGLSSTSDPTVSGLIGQHGALTPDEREIPAIILRGDARSSSA